LRDLLDNLLDIGQESHIKHTVSLVYYEVLNTRKVYGTPTNMIEETAWTSYYDLRFRSEIANLALV
jgi:hypothetical protein